MPEIPHTFGRIERSNERANASSKSLDCALGSFAQQCLQGMEHQLYRVQVRRVLRQVPQFCAGSSDRLLHAGDFVERDIVNHHNVAAPERVPSGMWLELRGAISSDVKLSDCRSAFKRFWSRRRAFRKPAGEFFEMGAIPESPLV